MKKSALVIGGNGFIGSQVIRQLILSNYEVIVYDKKPQKNKKIIYIHGDILDKNKINEAVSKVNFVYNFAALSDLNKAVDDPVNTASVNILGNVNVLEACRINKIKRFVYASTVYVNSRQGGFYRCSKHSSEQFIEEYQRQFNLPYTILRYGSIYGPGSDESNNLYKLIKKALLKGQIIFHGDKESIREYIHVEDAAKLSVIALSEKYKNQTLVLSGSESLKVIDFLKIISEILGYDESDVKFSNSQSYGHYVRTPYYYRTSIGRKMISDQHIDLGQGIIQLIDYVKQDLEK